VLFPVEVTPEWPKEIIKIREMVSDLIGNSRGVLRHTGEVMSGRVDFFQMGIDLRYQDDIPVKLKRYSVDILNAVFQGFDILYDQLV
jgi:hypothetical protein